MRISYLFVIADFLHYGILQIIKKANDISDITICGLLSDNVAYSVRGEYPISTFEERREVLSSLKEIDDVIIQDEPSPLTNLLALKQKHPKEKILLVVGSQFPHLSDEKLIIKAGIEIERHEYYGRLADNTIAKKLSKSYLIHSTLEPFENHIGNCVINRFREQGIQKQIISTKANTLANLYPRLKYCKIEKLFFFTVKQWLNFREDVLLQLYSVFNSSETVVVRSSSLNEDTVNISMAGFFKSVLNINLKNKTFIVDAINSVVKSFNFFSNATAFDQILVQRQTSNTLFNGVVFTKDIDTDTPYYTIYYTQKQDTTIVTGGGDASLLKIFKTTPDDLLETPWRHLKQALSELEIIIADFALDIEFAITKDFEVVIFQVRPLAASPVPKFVTPEAENNVSKAYEAIKNSQTLLSDMAFWNPAELIGDRPANLAYTLFQKLIAESAWNDGISRLGYPLLNERSKLLANITGKPYVDVKTAIKALTPPDIKTQLVDKIITYGTQKLSSFPHLHDKVEFEVILSCYDCCLDYRLQEMEEAGFTKSELKEIKNSLINFTNNTFLLWDKEYPKSRKEINLLNDYASTLDNISINTLSSENLKEIITSSIDNCIKYGTIPFSMVARMAFIVNALVKSMEKTKKLNHEDVLNIESSVKTIASDISEAIWHFASGRMNKNTFIHKFGHLRGGGYDITKPCYAQMCENFTSVAPQVIRNQKLDETIIKKLSNIFSTLPFEFTSEKFLSVYSHSIKAREKYKFIYTKIIDHILQIIKELGQRYGLSKSNLSYLDISDILQLNSKTSNNLKSKIERNKAIHEQRLKVILPGIICSSKDLFIVHYPKNIPNFIGKKIVVAETIQLMDDLSVDLYGKIVMIESADPGYHWIFSKQIGGLITKFGGAGSHMAICCAEFGIPAAIGCGHEYESLKSAKCLRLDPSKKKIEVINRQ